MFSSIKTLHSGVSVTRVTADIEIGQIQNLQTSSLSAIVDELEKFLKTEGDRLTRMVDGTQRVHHEIKCALEAIAARNVLPDTALLKAS